jgi:hypothetical protein
MQALPGVRAQAKNVARPLAQVVIVRGIVEGIDPVNRLFVLTDSAGKTTTIYAGDNLRNFEQLKLGEPATVRYSKAVALTVARNGVFGKRVAEAEPLSKALMEIPAEQLQAQNSMFGKVINIDLSNGYITVEGDDGPVEMRALSDQLITDLKMGERVLVTYVEATAISLQSN